MINAVVLEEKIAELLDHFYEKRIAKINELRLQPTLKRKNPYLFRAIGVQDASDIVKRILLAFMSSSEETMFGNVFFEPLVLFASGGRVSDSRGVDVSIETDTTYKAIAVKSGTSVFNVQSRAKQADNFRSLESRLRKIQKHFDPIVGYCYGKRTQRDDNNANFRELAGQAFWEEITGDPDFYLKIIRLMKEKPQEHFVEYEAAWVTAVNRLTREFLNEFCHEDGAIDWEKLTIFNSGI
jgi:hypothetical protein